MWGYLLCSAILCLISTIHLLDLLKIMLISFKEFKGDCYKHFKKYNDPKQARVNLPHRLVGRLEHCHFLCNHYLSRAFWWDLHISMLHYFTFNFLYACITLKKYFLAGVINDEQGCFVSSGSKSFLQRDNTSLLKNEVSQLIIWKCLGKHTLRVVNLFVYTLRLLIRTLPCKFIRYVCFILYFYSWLNNLIQKFIEESNAWNPILAHPKGFSTLEKKKLRSRGYVVRTY